MRNISTLLFCLCFLGFLPLDAQTIGLPRYPLASEIAPNDDPLFSPIGINDPPAAPVRAMAEWEELQSLLVTWRDYPTILTEIVRAARQECDVTIICSNSSVVNQAKTALDTSGVDLSSNVHFLVARNNSIWVRDYGPNCVYTNDVDSLLFVDWIYNRTSRPQDDTVATAIAPYFNVPLYSTSKAPSDLVNTGGNFMSDGMGTAFASQLILNENKAGNPYGVTVKSEAQIDQIFSDFMGIDRYIKMTPLPYDGIHHIDMHMKLLNEETLLVGKYPQGTADGPQIEANIQYVLNNFKTSFGTPYKVIRIPMPPESGQYPNFGGDYRTYANAVFVNKTVILPFYEQQFDTTARRIWQQALPGYKIVGIDCNDIIPALGAIHCITKEIGVQGPLRIVHKQIDEVIQGALYPANYPVTALIQHREGIQSAQVFFRRKGTPDWEAVSMTQSANPDSVNYWTGLIPRQEASYDSIFYYIEAKANNGKIQTRPMPGPEGAWKFKIQISVSAASEAEVGLEEIYPNPASAITVLPVKSSASTSGSICIFNSLGQKVREVYAGVIPAGESKYFIDASTMPAGTYFVQLSAGRGMEMKKLCIK